MTSSSAKPDLNFVHTLKKNIFSITPTTFKEVVFKVFEFQYWHNPIYHKYCKYLGKNPSKILSVEEIPFLPIEFFRNHKILCNSFQEEKIFYSSGTTSTLPSKHYIQDIQFYHSICKHIIESFFGDFSSTKLIALLPSYLKQKNSSLIEMINHLLPFASKKSGYFLDKNLYNELDSKCRIMLFGVSYALLDLPQIDNMPANSIVIETGGMKGRKKEIIRKELHEKICEKLKINTVWSEYGMTELHSQAYGINGDFSFPNWAKVYIRETNDPYTYVKPGNIGGINIVDLANVTSCSFIETKDLGKENPNGTFQILGRFDNSQLRGCNLMISE